MTPTNVAYLSLDSKPKAQANWKGPGLKFNPLSAEDKNLIWRNRYKTPFSIWQDLGKKHDQERIEFLIGQMEDDFEQRYGRKPTKED
jgi:hypothetical protein